MRQARGSRRHPLRGLAELPRRVGERADDRPLERGHVERGERQLAGPHPDQHDPGSEGRGAQAVAHGPAGPDGVEHRRRRPAERVLDLVGEITGRRVDRGEAQLLHEPTPRGARLRDHHLLRAEAARGQGAGLPDRAAADDQHGVVGRDASAACGVVPHRQRFDEGSPLLGHVVRQHDDVAGGREHQLGERRLDLPVDADHLPARAQLLAPGGALRALAAADHRVDGGDPARFTAVAGGVRAYGDDPAHRLVAHDLTGVPPLVLSRVAVQVRPADPGRGDAEQHLARARLRIGTLFDTDVVRAVVDEGAHGSVRLTNRRRGARVRARAAGRSSRCRPCSGTR